MDYRQYQAPDNSMLSSSRGMARLNGSNRAAWNAMDLEIGAQVPPANARGAPEDGGALSARNVLLHQKLRERKRYDSADDAMKKAAARAVSRYQSQSTKTQVPAQAPPPNPMVAPAPGQTPLADPQQACPRPYSPAQLGQSAFFNAMQGESLKPKRDVQRNPCTPMNEPLGGAKQARNVLIQRKLQSKASFDSADYQMAKQSAEHMEDTHMKDVGGMEPKQAMNSPCATSVANASRRQFANMSPSRASKYGSLENRKKPNRRDLLNQQPDEDALMTESQETGASEYGKLSAAHVLIRRKLKERKRFDSADYAMEMQGQPTDVPADVGANRANLEATTARYGTIGASQVSIDHQVKHIKLSESPSGRVASPAKQIVANAAQAALAARAARYAGLKGAGQVKPMPTTPLSHAACDRYGLDKRAVPSTAAVARNVVLQHKLAERKVFDSADHFNKAA